MQTCATKPCAAAPRPGLRACPSVFKLRNRRKLRTRAVCNQRQHSHNRHRGVATASWAHACDPSISKEPDARFTNILDNNITMLKGKARTNTHKYTQSLGRQCWQYGHAPPPHPHHHHKHTTSRSEFGSCALRKKAKRLAINYVEQ